MNARRTKKAFRKLEAGRPVSARERAAVAHVFDRVGSSAADAGRTLRQLVLAMDGASATFIERLKAMMEARCPGTDG